MLILLGLLRSRGGSKPQRLHHRIMQCRTNLLNLCIFPRRVHAVRQQHHKKLPIRINPNRSAGKSRVPKAVRRKIMPARPALGRHRPAERPGAVRELLRRRELRDRRAPQNPLVRVNAAIQQHLAERRQVRRRAEDSRMPGDSANRKRVFIVYFALHQAMQAAYEAVRKAADLRARDPRYARLLPDGRNLDILDLSATLLLAVHTTIRHEDQDYGFVMACQVGDGMTAVLEPGGRLILIVPALARLYGTLDENLHHFRRYEKPELEQKIRDAGFVMEDCRFLNRPGILGWYVNGRILRRRVLPRGQLAAFRLL